MPPYQNGRLPSKALYRVQGTMLANHDTAHDWKRLRAAAKSEADVVLTIAPPAGAYRSEGTQSAMHKNPAKYNVTDASIMAPVGASSHGFGNNLDVYATKKPSGGRTQQEANAAAWAWLLKHMGDYGFHQRDAKGDPHCLAHA